MSNKIWNKINVIKCDFCNKVARWQYYSGDYLNVCSLCKEKEILDLLGEHRWRIDPNRTGYDVYDNFFINYKCSSPGYPSFQPSFKDAVNQLVKALRKYKKEISV